MSKIMHGLVLQLVISLLFLQGTKVIEGFSLVDQLKLAAMIICDMLCNVMMLHIHLVAYLQVHFSTRYSDLTWWLAAVLTALGDSPDGSEYHSSFR